MSNLETYRNCFVDGLELDVESVESASMESVERWDSIGQMSLIALVEDAFGIELDPEEIMTFTSFAAGLEILKCHGIDF